ncbi:MAG: hypothetical protein LC772_12110 [Chloroflexi bacterium]|nr:hypothetical protein [Chloroflexota bacterium]
MEDDPDDDLNQEEQYSEAARQMLAGKLLDADRLAEGLPGMTDRDLDAAEWLLARGGVSSLDDYLAAFPPDETAPSDMLLEYGLVAEGRLSGKLTRMVPVDLRSPLAEALRHRSEW